MAHTFHRDDATFSAVDYGDLVGSAVTQVISVGNISSTVWSTYTPTITAGTGSFTSTSATGRWQAIGKTTFVNVAVTITNSGTGTSLIVSLPATAAAARQQIGGKEVAVHGRMLNADVGTSSSTMLISDFNNTFPVSTGAVLYITGIYERS